MAQFLNRREALEMMISAPLMAATATMASDADAKSATAGPLTTIALVMFEEITLLDLVGPLQVLRGLGPSYDVVVVGEHIKPMMTDVGLPLAPQRSLLAVPRPDVVLVPGGAGSVAAMANEPIQKYLKATAQSAQLVASVCTGALVLAATGLLEGRRATTHWAYARELEQLGAHYVRERWTADGKFMTGAGVSAGLDMALALVERLAGRSEARRIQLGIEYDPRPQLGAIDWSQVGETELKRQRQGGTGRRLAEADRLLVTRPDLLRRLRRPVP